MPLFYFHLRDGEDVLLDPDGLELDDRATIARRALIEARSILSQDMLEGRINLNQHIDVADGGGLIVHSLWFCDAVQIVRKDS